MESTLDIKSLLQVLARNVGVLQESLDNPLNVDKKNRAADTQSLLLQTNDKAEVGWECGW